MSLSYPSPTTGTKPNQLELNGLCQKRLEVPAGVPARFNRGIPLITFTYSLPEFLSTVVTSSLRMTDMRSRLRYRLYKRKNGGRYYVHDDVTGKQISLGTSDKATALRLHHARQEAEQQPAVNLQIARAYLAGSDPQIATRNWQFVMEELVKLKKEDTQLRWKTAVNDKAFDLIRRVLLCSLTFYTNFFTPSP